MIGNMEDRKKVTRVELGRDVAHITMVGVRGRPGVVPALFESLAWQRIIVDTIVQNVGIKGTVDVSFTVSGDDLRRAWAIVRAFMGSLGARNILFQDGLAKVSIVGSGMQNEPGYAARMFRALADEGINIEMITTSEIRITCIVRLGDAEKAAQALRAAFELEVP